MTETLTTWSQNYDPLHNAVASTAVAALPALVLFYLLAVRRVAAWKAAVGAFLVGVVLAGVVFGMPARMIAGAVSAGLVYGWFRIAWVVVAAVFVYEISVESGQFEIIKSSISRISADRRLQALLIAFAFGALLEGAGGGGAPVAVTGAMLIGLGFPPFQTALLCLVANSAPVAFGGLGNPIRTLGAVTGLPDAAFSAMVGRILPLTTLVLPFWMMRLMSTWGEMMRIWPGLLMCGVTFGVLQFTWSNFMEPSLVDIVAGIGTLLVLAVFFGKVWHPATVMTVAVGGEAAGQMPTREELTAGRILKAWSPFLMLTVFVVLWGVPAISSHLDALSYKAPVAGLHKLVLRQPPAVSATRAESALFDVSWLSSVGTGTFLSGWIIGPMLGLSFGQLWRIFVRTLSRLRASIAAILAMLSLGYLTRYCGMDATLGLALAKTGVLFPLFGTLIGWLGVALSGTDAGSNALFGSLQMITANNLGLSPILMGAANSAGGVMGKMIAAQSLVIACAATGQPGQEGAIFRAVVKHSILLALLVGLIVMMYAYVYPGAIPVVRQP